MKKSFYHLIFLLFAFCIFESNANADGPFNTPFCGTVSGGGTGDVTGPGSSNDGNLVMFSGTDGKTIAEIPGWIYNALNGRLSITHTQDWEAIDIISTGDSQSMALTNIASVARSSGRVLGINMQNNNDTTGISGGIEMYQYGGSASGTPDDVDSGNFINMIHSQFNKSSDFIYMMARQDSGIYNNTFSGNFLNFYNDTNQVFKVGESGVISSTPYNDNVINSRQHYDYDALRMNMHGRVGEGYPDLSGNYALGVSLEGDSHAGAVGIDDYNVDVQVTGQAPYFMVNQGGNDRTENVFTANMRQGGGTFTGNFLKYMSDTTTDLFWVNSDGAVRIDPLSSQTNSSLWISDTNGSELTQGMIDLESTTGNRGIFYNNVSATSYSALRSVENGGAGEATIALFDSGLTQAKTSDFISIIADDDNSYPFAGNFLNLYSSGQQVLRIDDNGTIKSSPKAGGWGLRVDQINDNDSIVLYSDASGVAQTGDRVINISLQNEDINAFATATPLRISDSSFGVQANNYIHIVQGNDASSDRQGTVFNVNMNSGGLGAWTGRFIDFSEDGVSRFIVRNDGSIEPHGGGQDNVMTVINDDSIDGDFDWVKIKHTGTSNNASNAIDVSYQGAGSFTGNYLNLGNLFKVDYTGKLIAPAYARHIQVPVTTNSGQTGVPTAKSIGTVGCVSWANAATPDEIAFIQWEVPDDWNETDITLELDTVIESAMSDTNALTFNITYRAIAQNEVVTTGTVESVAATYTSSGATAQDSMKHISVNIPVTGTNQSLVKQDHIYFQINRKEDDTYTGAGCVSAAEILYDSIGLPTSN